MIAIERIKNFSPQNFRDNFVAKRKPVVIEDATKNWDAIKKWSNDFWIKNYGDKKVVIDNKYYNLKEIIELAKNSDENNPAPYYRNIRIDHEYPELKPDIFPESDFCLPNKFYSPLLKPLKNSFLAYGQYELFIGGKGRSFPYLHS